MKNITIDCAAKINIGLDIIRKRDDGYHDIATLMHSVALFDSVECIKSKNTLIECNDPSLDCGKSNIVYQCIESMREIYSINDSMKVKLSKNIPVGSGLGGGSSDGAAALAAFAKLYDISITVQMLAKISSKIGADIPFMFYGGLCLCEGIGDIITPLGNAANYFAVIIKPDICVSSANAYREIDQSSYKSKPTDFVKAATTLKAGKLNLLKDNLYNCFEYTAEKKYPLITKIKNDLYEQYAQFAQMSGSGSAVYGIFECEANAKQAFDKLSIIHKKIYLAKLCDKSLYIRN